jgi:TetR/AcrR family transcriptional regulator, transcriptional repressor for nem operon
MHQDENRLNEILSAAELLFRSKGYHSTSMADVAEVCHFQKAALYYHVSSKEELSLAVMTKVQAFFDNSVFIYAYDKSFKPQSRLLKFNNAVKKYYLTGSGGCLFASFAIEQIDTIPAFVVPIRKYFNSWSNAYKSIFVDVYNSEEAQAIAEGFVSDLQGALVMFRVTQDPKHLIRLFNRSTLALHPDRSRIKAKVLE